MNLRTYLKMLDKEEKNEFVKKANTSLAYLSQLIGGHRKAGKKTMLAIEKASGGHVTRQELRPDIFS